MTRIILATLMTVATLSSTSLARANFELAAATALTTTSNCIDRPGWAYYGWFNSPNAASEQAFILQQRGFHTVIDRSYGKYYLYYR